jgi:hypothetical protein
MMAATVPLFLLTALPAAAAVSDGEREEAGMFVRIKGVAAPAATQRQAQNEATPVIAEGGGSAPEQRVERAAPPRPAAQDVQPARRRLELREREEQRRGGGLPDSVLIERPSRL